MSSLSKPQSAEVLLKGAIWIWNRHKSVLWLAINRRNATDVLSFAVPTRMRVGSCQKAVERERRNRSNLPVSKPESSMRPKLH